MDIKSNNTIPEHEYIEHVDTIRCVTMDLIKKYHTEAEAERFYNWHSGQTGIILPGNIRGIYSWDYERWCQQGNLDHQLEDWD